MALAARRMRTRGLAKKARKPSRGAKRDSPTRLFGPWRRSRCLASAEVSPAGVASSRIRRSRWGISQKRSNVLSGLLMRSLSLEFYTLFGLDNPTRAARSRPAATAGIGADSAPCASGTPDSAVRRLARTPHVAQLSALDPHLQFMRREGERRCFGQSV